MVSDTAGSETHQVFNQPSPLENYNLYTSDKVLRHYVSRFGGAGEWPRLEAYGHAAGHELLAAGFAANRHKPEFQPHDRFGRRLDQVNYHPAYHQLMAWAIGQGQHSLPWTGRATGAQLERAAMTYLHIHADPGTACPLTMTFAAVPTLRHQPDIASQWLTKILHSEYDPRNVPYGDKTGVTIGMAMTEKQGGSDVRANTTQATPLGTRGPGRRYTLVGHKWFCSAPMSDAFLVLAQSAGGLSCFLLPRWRPDGDRNAIHIQRLKDKMGNCSNASAEVEFRGAEAWLIGDEGRGVATILEMVACTRLDCVVGSAALMHQAAAEAIHHCRGRRAFGEYLSVQPLMANVLADLAIESEAALAVALRLARAFDRQQDPQEAALLRLGTALGKYWVCKRAPGHIAEAMECIGGVAAIEDNVLARLYREAPVNAIWEGSGNIQCLDVARALTRAPELVPAWLAEMEPAQGSLPVFDTALASLKDSLAGELDEGQLRMLVEPLAITWQAATLLRYGDPVVAETFAVNRLGSGRGLLYGTLGAAADRDHIIARTTPTL